MRAQGVDRVGLWGRSMGAATAVRYAARWGGGRGEGRGCPPHGGDEREGGARRGWDREGVGPG